MKNVTVNCWAFGEFDDAKRILAENMEGGLRELKERLN
jgi:hypothetical protein